ncbi:Uncharacterized protein Fot_38807 [Forsythia ovata]|uniref:Uncharacterized protein n=1 Tax=Forsythia ovata TaxID=205694 RepID=A0ABD1S2X3_9LAMI
MKRVLVEIPSQISQTGAKPSKTGFLTGLIRRELKIVKPSSAITANRHSQLEELQICQRRFALNRYYMHIYIAKDLKETFLSFRNQICISEEDVPECSQILDQPPPTPNERDLPHRESFN